MHVSSIRLLAGLNKTGLTGIAGAAAILICGGGVGCGSPSESPSISASAPEPTPIVKTPTANPPALSIASYNINAGMTGNAATREALTNLHADIIVLQEVTAGWKRELASMHTESHPHRSFHIDSRQHYGGLAMLSRFPIRDGVVLRDGPGPFPAWRGVVDTPLGAIQIINVHLFPPVAWFRSRGIMRAYRESQERHKKELVAHYASVSPKLPTVVAGDFNENRSGDAIQWLLGRGFETAHQGNRATWRWVVRGFEVTFQLDHILLRGLRATSADIHTVGESDHLPITATLIRAD